MQGNSFANLSIIPVQSASSKSQIEEDQPDSEFGKLLCMTGVVPAYNQVSFMHECNAEWTDTEDESAQESDTEREEEDIAKGVHVLIFIVYMPMHDHCSMKVSHTYIFDTESTKEWEPKEASSNSTVTSTGITTVMDIDSTADMGYKIVGDNLDKNIRPRFQTMERQTQSMHYFHCYAVVDRIPTMHLTDAPPAPLTDLRVDISRITPSEICHCRMKVAFATLVSR